MSLIALITDFGTKDWFVGEMKGILYGISPGTTIVDITHGIPPNDVRTAAFVLLASYSNFPRDTIFCTAVGSTEQCRSIAVQTKNHLFIGPDNGIISWAIRKDHYRAWCIENKEYTRPQFSTTFQARDIFGPAAAFVAKGVLANQLGPEKSDIVQIPYPQPIPYTDRIQGEIIYIDSFGNAVTNIELSCLRPLSNPCTYCILNDKYTVLIKRQYQDVNPLEGLCYPGSAGFMEIGVRSVSGASIYEIAVGQKVEIY